MYKLLLTRVVVVGILGIATGSAWAHHSVVTNYFEYDENPLVVVGTVKEVEIRNPHALVIVDVVEDDGTVVEWLFEWNDGNALRRRAVAVDRLKVGDEETMRARRHRRVPHVAFIHEVVLPDGTLVRDCGFSIYRGDEHYATCEEAERAKK